MSFWGELRRRKVVKVAIAYAIVGWILVQVAATFFPALQLPEWTVTLVAALVILGFPIALILSWAFDLTAEGIVRTSDSKKLAATDDERDPASESSNAPHGSLVHPQHPATGQPERAEQLAGERAPGRDADTAQPAASARETGGYLANSVAVLPLDNLSPDPDNAYFAAGLHEEILNQLAKLSGLNVISRTSVLQYAKDRPSIAEIAKALNVQSVMEGSIRYAGNRIRATVQLINSESGAHLWSETYERELEDIFAIESDIAINVAKALEAKFSTEEQRAVEKAPTKSTEAYNIYLQIMPIRYAHVNVALDLCDQALALDPDFALVHMTKGYLYANAIVANIGQTSVDAEERISRFEELARFHAERAHEIDPSLESAYLGHALLDFYQWHWSRARAAFDRMKLNDLDTLGLQFYVWLCAYQGDLERALEIARRAVDLGPHDWRARWGLATAHAYSGDYAAAREIQRHSINLNPSLPVLHNWLAYIDIPLGEKSEALGELMLTERLMGQHRDVVSLPEIAHCYSRLGKTSEVERLTAEVHEFAREREVGAGTWTVMHVANGDLDSAADSMKTAIDEAKRHVADQGFWPLINMKMNVTADPVLEEPRFVELRDQIRGD